MTGSPRRGALAVGSDPRASRRSVWVRVGLLVVAVVLLVLAYQGTRTVLALRDAQSAAEQFQAQLSEGDRDAAADSARELASSARVARQHSDGILWRATTYLPFVSDDLAAVRDLSSAMDQLAPVAPAGLALIDQVGDADLRRDDGGIDLGVVERLRPALDDIAAAADGAQRTAQGVDPRQLVGRLAGPAQTFLDRVETLHGSTAAAATAARVLPGILGADGPRTYLLVVQNNAEIRATGGLPGSASVITADDGSIDLGFQGSSGDVMGDGSPVADFLPGEEEVFGPLLVTDFRDTNFTPDFPRAASLMTQFADRSREEQLDGVVSVDPVLLAQVLGSTGPVEVAGGQLTADDAVRALLFEPYVRFSEGSQQDAFFRVAARAILDALLSDAGDQVELVRTLGEGIGQRRLLFWSAEPEVQSQVEDLAVAGALPADTGRPEVGLYLNDGTEAKMQYFLRSEADIVSEGCDVDGRQVVRVRWELTNDLDVPLDSLTDFVTGNGRLAPRGDNRMQLRMFAPSGGELLGLEVDGERIEVGQSEVYGRQVTQTRVQLAPQESLEVVAQFAGRPGQEGDPRLQWTPGIEWGPTQEVATSRC